MAALPPASLALANSAAAPEEAGPGGREDPPGLTPHMSPWVPMCVDSDGAQGGPARRQSLRTSGPRAT
eukprot:13970134-Alexandrium_andersonii.AAC.1